MMSTMIVTVLSIEKATTKKLEIKFKFYKNEKKHKLYVDFRDVDVRMTMVVGMSVFGGDDDDDGDDDVDSCDVFASILIDFGYACSRSLGRRHCLH